MNGADGAALIARARELVPALLQRSAQCEAGRRVPDETIADFQRAGFFRVLQPKRFGGLQLDFRVFALIVRELAHGCGSSAWVYAVVGELGWVMAMLPEEGQRDVWGSDPSALGCAAVDPSGKAEKVAGGYRLTGQWRFVSGSDHTQWVFLTSTCEESGAPVIRQFLVRRGEVEFIDDWHVLGLVGTGSRSVKATDVFVPEHRTITQQSFLDGTAPGTAVHRDAVTYRSPRRYLTSFSLSPVIVGLAERALGIVTEATRQRVAKGSPPPELETLQLRVAEAAGEIEAARLILNHTLAEATLRLTRRDTISDQDVLRNRFMGAQMVRLARSAVDRLCMASGSGWVFDDHALQIVFRDAMTGSTHRAMHFETHARNYARSLGIG